MGSLDIALVVTIALLVSALILPAFGVKPRVLAWGATPWVLGLAALAAACTEVHLLLPDTLSPVNQATFWVFVWALLLQVAAGAIAIVNEELDFSVSIRDEPVPYSQGRIGGIRGGGSGVFWRLYTQEGRNNLGDGRGGNRYEDTRWYAPPWRPFNLPAREVGAFQRLLRGVSLLSLAVMGIVRLTQEEPILNLF